MKKIALHWWILIGLIAGIVFGYFSSGVKISEVVTKDGKVTAEAVYLIDQVSWIGQFFLNALKMIIVPLILSSVISGITSIGNISNLGRLGGKTMGYYLGTSFLAIIVGLIMVNLIQPGIGADLGFQEVPSRVGSNEFTWYSIFMTMVFPNFFQALASGKMLSIITFSIVFGVIILKMEGSYRETLQNFFDAVFEAMMKITGLVIKLTPIGVFGIVAGVVASAVQEGTLGDIAGRLAWYSVTVLSALIIHSLVVLPLLLYLVGKIKNPFSHVKSMATPLLNAFGTASSSATLPLTMEAVEKKAGISNRVSSFTLPLGATVNMDGTALYECIAVIFIAQAYGIDLGIGQQFIVVITALTASIGAAGIPGAGLVMMSVVLTAVGLPLEGVGLILAVDRVLDMCRTAVNVWSDSCGAAIIAKTEGETLAYEEPDQVQATA